MMGTERPRPKKRPLRERLEGARESGISLFRRAFAGAEIVGRVSPFEAVGCLDRIRALVAVCPVLLPGFLALRQAGDSRGRILVLLHYIGRVRFVRLLLCGRFVYRWTGRRRLLRIPGTGRIDGRLDRIILLGINGVGNLHRVRLRGLRRQGGRRCHHHDRRQQEDYHHQQYSSHLLLLFHVGLSINIQIAWRKQLLSVPVHIFSQKWDRNPITVTRRFSLPWTFPLPWRRRWKPCSRWRRRCRSR